MKPCKGPTAIVDADWLVYRIGFASGEDTTEAQAKARLTEYLTTIVYMEGRCDDYELYIGGEGNFRYQVAVTHPYKGNRSAPKPPFYTELRNHLVKLEAVKCDGQEADDMVAIRNMQITNGLMIHVDKDLDQLPGKHFNPVKGLKYTIDEFTGFKNFCTQMLTGDRIDNIVGLKQIGPVKASKILAEAKTQEELWKSVVKAYKNAGESYDRVVENGKLLWLRRTPEEDWKPPYEDSY